jgi:predicted MFS family arabinose efflux permease
MIVGYFLSAFVIFGYILSIDFNGYLVNQILISLSYSFFWTATHFYISQKTDPSNKGKYIGLANSSFYLGSFLGSLFFSTLIGVYSEYYIPMTFMIVFPALSAFLIIIFFRKSQ